MEYSRIVAITGLPGLYEILSSKNDGALVLSLSDNTTKFVTSRAHNMSHLESIEVYTVRDNVNLAGIFQSMQSGGEALPDVKDNAALKAYFEKVYPELDFERVYASDMKKMVKWFEIIQSNNIDFESTQPAEEETEEDTEAVTAEGAETAEATAEKPAKAKKAKASTPDAEGEDATEDADKPKRTRKKKTEE